MALGVPVISPVAGLRVRLSGSEPDTDQEYGCSPPIATIVWL